MHAANCEPYSDLYLFTSGTCERKLYNFRHISHREVRLLLLQVPRPARLKMYSQKARAHKACIYAHVYTAWHTDNNHSEHSHEKKKPALMASYFSPNAPPDWPPLEIHRCSHRQSWLSESCSSPHLLPGTSPMSWFTLALLQSDTHTHTHSHASHWHLRLGVRPPESLIWAST